MTAPDLITLPAALFKRLKSLKECNLHSECYEEAAKGLGHAELEIQFDRIRQIHERDGELRFELSHERRRAYERMIAYARSNLSPVQFNKLYMCF